MGVDGKADEGKGKESEGELELIRFLELLSQLHQALLRFRSLKDIC